MWKLVLGEAFSCARVYPGYWSCIRLCLEIVDNRLVSIEHLDV